MSKSSKLAHVAGKPFAAFFLVGLMAISAGCGGGSDDFVAAAPPAPPAPPPADPIEGVATPSSVAVVTATNAE
jgi:hypothetical protein